MSKPVLICPSCGGEDLRMSYDTGLYQCFSSRSCRWIGEERKLLVSKATWDALFSKPLKHKVIMYGSHEWRAEQKKQKVRDHNISLMVEAIQLSVSKQDVDSVTYTLHNSFDSQDVETLVKKLRLSYNINSGKPDLIKLIINHIISRGK